MPEPLSDGIGFGKDSLRAYPHLVPPPLACPPHGNAHVPQPGWPISRCSARPRSPAAVKQHRRCGPHDESRSSAPQTPRSSGPGSSGSVGLAPPTDCRLRRSSSRATEARQAPSHGAICISTDHFLTASEHYYQKAIICPAEDQSLLSWTAIQDHTRTSTEGANSAFHAFRLCWPQ